MSCIEDAQKLILARGGDPSAPGLNGFIVFYCHHGFTHEEVANEYFVMDAFHHAIQLALKESGAELDTILREAILKFIRLGRSPRQAINEALDERKAKPSSNRWKF